MQETNDNMQQQFSGQSFFMDKDKVTGDQKSVPIIDGKDIDFQFDPNDDACLLDTRLMLD